MNGLPRHQIPTRSGLSRLTAVALWTLPALAFAPSPTPAAAATPDVPTRFLRSSPSRPNPKPPPPLEHLGRGLVAVPNSNGTVLVSWRWLATDVSSQGFHVYRSDNGGPVVRLTPRPWLESTCFLDPSRAPNSRSVYSLRTVSAPLAPNEGPAFPRTQESREGPSVSSFLAEVPAGVDARDYLEIPLSLPEGSVPNDASAADLDGDGEYEIVLKSEQRPRDPSSTGLTGDTILQGYTLRGALLWTIHLGRNIREGAHYTPFVAIDLDGDGRAEVACKTADGTRDGRGRVLGDPRADWRDTNTLSRTFGRVLAGPEFLTIFDGRTGKALATAPYVPPRGDLGGWGGIGGNGGNDRLGNRADRFLACAAVLDGRLPSLVFCRGYYGRTVLAAWDWRGGRLTQRWVFDSAAAGHGKDGKPLADYSGMGAHSVSVADVDGDGRQEILYHSMVVDDDGRGLFTTGLRHGDALHVGNFDPRRPGLEVFGVHENEEETVRFGTPGTACYDAATGGILWSDGPGVDVGRGLVADIDPRHPGAESWSWAAGLRTARGERLGPAPRSQNFAVWWDGDLLRELLDRTTISKWDWEKGTLQPLRSFPECAANNGSKATPCLTADLFGDWREEVVWRTRDNRALRVYSTAIPTRHRLPTLMHDLQYRMAIAWQNAGYNQPPHPGYFLGESAPGPDIR